MSLRPKKDCRSLFSCWYGQEAEDFEALRVGLQQILMTELARNTARQRNGCNS